MTRYSVPPAERLRLQRERVRRGWRHRPAVASDGQGHWREPGWLIRDLRLDQAIALARRFRQGGLLYWRRRQAMDLLAVWPPPDAGPLTMGAVVPPSAARPVPLQ